MATRKRLRQLRSIDEILKSAELEDILLDIGHDIQAAASTDPNPAYVASLDTHVFDSRDRVVVQVGAAPGIGNAVEAARGTLARALGAVGA